MHNVNASNPVPCPLDPPALARLVYVSEATRPLTPAELYRLHELSRRRNALMGVTGILLHRAGRFMQLLEGPKPAVRALFQKISRDPRHHGVTRLLYEPTDHRLHRDWHLDVTWTVNPPACTLTQLVTELDELTGPDAPLGEDRDACIEALLETFMHQPLSPAPAPQRSVALASPVNAVAGLDAPPLAA